MTPQFNSVPHDPPNSYGNCYSACLASLLDVPVTEVPHFYGDPDNFTPDEAVANVRKWLAERGLCLIQSIFPGETRLTAVLYAVDYMNPGQRYVLTGKSAQGYGHSVICCNGAIEHDPAGSGIIGPANNYWWVEFIGSAV